MTSFYGSVNGGQGGSGEGVDTSTLMQKNNPTFNGTITGPNAHFTGTVQIPEPTEDNHAATKAYVDAALADVDLSEVTTRMDAIETAQDELAAQLDDKVGAENPAFTGTATLNGKNVATIDQIPNVSDLPYLDENNPTYTGNLTGENAVFSGTVTVATPAAEGEAANKGYVDSAKTELEGDISTLQQTVNTINQQVTNITSGTEELPYLKNTGDSGTGVYDFTGATVNAADPVDNSNVATKHYVDQKVASAGGTGEVVSYTQGDGISISPENEISLSIDSAGANGLKVGANGLGLDLATDTTPGAMAASDKTAIASNTTEITNIKNGTTELSYLKETNPTYEGTLIGGDATFTGSVQISTPDQDNEAANKSYVDTALAEAKSYTDDAVSGIASDETIQQIQTDIDNIENGTTELPYIKDNGDTVTGTYNFTGANMTIAEPTVSNNPATKNYVDTKIASAGDSGEVVSYTQGNGINISPENVISVVVDADNANGLAIDTGGVKLNLATASSAGAMSSTDKTKLDATSTTEQMNQAISSAIDETLAEITEDPTKLPFVNINGDTMHGSLTTTELFTDFVTIRNAGTDGKTGFQNNSDTDHIRVYDKVADTLVPIEVGEPVNNQDASTKKYVDDKVTTETAARTEAIEDLNEAKADKNNPTFTGTLSGVNATLSGTLTGNTATFSGGVTVPLEPSAEGSAASKKYVDDSIATIDVSGQIEPLAQRVTAAETEIDTLQSDMTTAQSDIDAVEASVSNITNGTTQLPYLPLTGGTVTGPVMYGTAPATDTELTNKAYVDAQTAQAKTYSDTNLETAKDYTDTSLESVTARVAALETAQTEQDTEIAGLKDGTTELPYVTKEEVDINGSPQEVARAYRYTFNNEVGSTHKSSGFGFIDLTPAIVTEVDGSTSFSPLYVGEPEKDIQAATKKYVDESIEAINVTAQLTPLTERVTTAESEIDALQTEVSNIKDGTLELPYVKKSGDTMAGLLTLNQGLKNVNVFDPSYETNLSSNILSFKHDSIVKMLGMQSNKLKFTDSGASNLVTVEVGTPVEDNDAANKKYVDEAINKFYHAQVLAATSKDQVDNLFASWWKTKWVEGVTTYNSMLEDWFENVLYDDRVHGVKLPLWETSHSQRGEFTDDSVGLTCEISTNDYAGRDDFAYLPQFWCVEVAVEKNADYTHTIYACEFIDDINIVRAGGPNDGKHLVWVLQKNTYRREWEEEGYKYLKTRCTPAEGYTTWLQGTDNEGRVYPYVGIPKYAAGIEEDGTIGSRAGLKPAIFESYDSGIQKWRARGSQYTGGSYLTLKWQLDMIALKYASKGNSNGIEGCVNFNIQTPVLIAESNANRVIINQDQANNFLVGQYINIGSGDRLVSETNVLITNIETVNISETDYLALTFEGDPIETTTSQKVCSLAWPADLVTNLIQGNDGQAFKGQTVTGLVQKTEFLNGAYLITSDEKWKWDAASDHEDGSRTFECYICEDANNITTGNSFDNYTLAASINFPAAYNNSSKYITDIVTTDKQIVFPKAVSNEAGSTTGYGDCMWIYFADNVMRAPWHCGALWDGSHAGLARLPSGFGSSVSYWNGGVGAPGLAK